MFENVDSKITSRYFLIEYYCCVESDVMSSSCMFYGSRWGLPQASTHTLVATFPALGWTPPPRAQVQGRACTAAQWAIVLRLNNTHPPTRSDRIWMKQWSINFRCTYHLRFLHQAVEVKVALNNCYSIVNVKVFATGDALQTSYHNNSFFIIPSTTV